MDPTSLYDRQVVDKIAVRFCYRYGLSDDDCADFCQNVHLKLIEDDYARLRRFEGKSDLRTFLHVTIKRVAIDHLIKQRGKWRPSATAKRLGPAAVELEILMHRDNLPREAAIQVMVSRNTHGLTENELRQIALRLPPRTNRQEDTVAGDVPDGHLTEEPVLRNEREERMTAARGKLARALEALDPEERLIIKMRYWDGFTAVRIKEILGIKGRIHDRVARILERLRSRLMGEGVEVADVRELFPD